MGVRTGADAIAYTRARVGTSMPAAGYCLQFVREDFNVAPLYASAIDAWNACAAPHPGDWNPPPAVPVWFASPSIYDHVAFYVSPTEVISTYNDDIRSFAGLDAIQDAFTATFLGWGEDINGVGIMPGPDPTPPPPLELEDAMRVIYDPETYSYALVGAGYAYVIPNQEQADAAQKVYGQAVNMGTRYAWDLAFHMGLNGTVAPPTTGAKASEGSEGER